MGTRATTTVLDGTTPLVTTYRQMDGGPSCHGARLKEICDGMVVVDGYGHSTPEKAANGIECLAAQIVAQLKTGIGSIYIVRPGDEEEFDYRISVKKGVIHVRVKHWGEVIYTGPIDGMPTGE